MGCGRALLPVITMTFETRRFGQRPISTDVHFDWRWAGRLSLRRPLTVRTNPAKSALRGQEPSRNKSAHPRSWALSWAPQPFPFTGAHNIRWGMLVFAQVDGPLQRGDLDRLRTRKTGLTLNALRRMGWPALPIEGRPLNRTSASRRR